MDSSKKRTDTDHAERLLHVVDRWQRLAAIVLVVLLLVAYWYLPSIQSEPTPTEWQKEVVNLLRSLITNLIPVFALFAISWWLLRTVEAVRKEREHQQTVDAIAAKVREELLPHIVRVPVVHRRFDDVPWTDMIRGSDSVNIIVHYFDSWAKTYQDDLIDLFTRGGTVRVLLPDPEDVGALEQIKMRFLESEQPGVQDKILKTPARFAAIRRSAKSAGRLEVRLVKLPIWYCALRFSTGSVALSPYESNRTVGVKSPCVVLHGSEAQDVVGWFDDEFDFLWAKARTWTG